MNMRANERIKQYRRGVTLIEMLVVMAVFTVVLTIAIGMLTLLLRLDERSRRHTDRLLSTDRLARALRADVRAALRAHGEPADPAGQAVTLLVLSLANDTQIVYEPQTNGLRRTKKRADATLTTEKFRLDQSLTTLVLDDSGDDLVVKLRVDKRDEVHHELGSPRFEAIAVVGADHRFEEKDVP